MQKWIAGMMVALVGFWLPINIRQSAAMSVGHIVTKANQKELGVDFQISAARVSKDVVMVQMKIPRQGKLEKLKAVQMWIGEGKPLLFAPLETKPDKNGALAVNFQLAPEFAEKCSIHLTVANDKPNAMDYEHFYSIVLKEYITEKK